MEIKINSLCTHENVGGGDYLNNFGKFLASDYKKLNTDEITDTTVVGFLCTKGYIIKSTENDNTVFSEQTWSGSFDESNNVMNFDDSNLVGIGNGMFDTSYVYCYFNDFFIDMKRYDTGISSPVIDDTIQFPTLVMSKNFANQAEYILEKNYSGLYAVTYGDLTNFKVFFEAKIK